MPTNLFGELVLVTNNGATSGVVNWTPTAAGTYYYLCSAHDVMYGTITVQKQAYLLQLVQGFVNLL